MKIIPIKLPVLLSISLSFSSLMIAAEAQTVAIPESVQIPGALLKAGSYSFSVEDRLADRAIVRITSSQDSNQHYLLLTVPNSKLAGGNQLSFFKVNGENKQALKAWKCSSCSAPLEFVYPKLEAVKITDDSTEPVMAVDPSYDKLPSDLAADDMKVVTLWLLSPERVTADNVGQGVKAAKYVPEPAQEASAPVAPPATTDTSSAATQVASAQPPATPRGRRHLPKTASNTDLFLICGLVCLGGALTVRMRRLRAI